MILAHLADLHLGFRQFHAQTPAGINQREADVASAFTRCVEAIVATTPDLVVVAGDVFHSARPSNLALVHAVRQFQRLVSACPVVVVAGNHDSPRASDAGHPLSLLAALGVQVVLSEPTRVRVGDVAVWCVPDTGVPQPLRLEPDPHARYNVALIHGEVAGVIKGAPEKPHEIQPNTLAGDGWDYIALGHYHTRQQVAPCAWYAGAPEFTSSNPWAEIGEPKGGLLADLASHTVAPLDVPSVRRFVDLPRLSASGVTPAQLVEQIDAHAGDLSGAVVRQVVTDCDVLVSREVSRTALRRWRRSSLHFAFDARRPDVPVMAGQARNQRSRRSLAEMLADVLVRRAELSGLAPDALLAAGTRYLDEVGVVSTHDHIAEEFTDDNTERAA